MAKDMSTLPTTLTVVLQSRILVKEHGLLEKIVKTLTDLVIPCKNPGKRCIYTYYSTFVNAHVNTCTCTVHAHVYIFTPSAYI